jgi:hypothetical protein
MRPSISAEHSVATSRRRRTRRAAEIFGTLALCMTFISSVVGGQTLRGVIVDSTSARRIAGVVVTLFDSAGNIQSRSIASATGHFAIPFLASSRLRLVRIGYRPLERRLGPDAARDSLRLAMIPIPVRISAVRVSGRSLCPGDVNRGDALAMWEQARSALLATIVARETRPAAAKSLLYERHVDPSSEATHQSVRVRLGSTTQPFVASKSAATFAEVGYVSDGDDGGRVFSAPDADILLDEAFASSHCFKLVRGGGGRRTQIGLAFEPLRDRGTKVDVAGTLWLDSSATQLRDLEFRYQGLDRASERIRPGGKLAFETMANGIVYVTSWSIRVPVLAQRRSRTQASLRGRIREVDLFVTQVKEVGGEIASATWSDGTAWRQALTRLSGTVETRGAREPVRGAHVLLENTDYRTRTDSAGRFELLDVLPGAYTMVVRDTALATFLPVRNLEQEVKVERGRDQQLTFTLNGVMELAAARCANAREPVRPVFVGRLRLPTGERPPIAQLRAIWAVEDSVRAHDPRTGYMAQLGTDGAFTLCNVPDVARVTFSVHMGTKLVLDTMLSIPRHVLSAAEITIDTSRQLLRVVSHGREGSGTAPQRLPAMGTVLGIVQDAASGSPLANSEVHVVDSDRVSRTDAEGRFALGGLLPGSHVLRARQIGYGVFEDTIVIAAGDTLRRTVRLQAARALPALNVTADRIVAKMSAFEERRRGGFGSFLTRSELEKSTGRRTGDVLNVLTPGGIRRGGSSAWVVASRGETSIRPRRIPLDAASKALGARPEWCYADVYVDGALMGVPFDVNSIPVDIIEGIEFYKGPSTTPSAYRRTGSECGVLLIWTRIG